MILLYNGESRFSLEVSGKIYNHPLKRMLPLLEKMPQEVYFKKTLYCNIFNFDWIRAIDCNETKNY